MENKKIKFAVIGFGHIGRRHAEMIYRNPEAELVAICDVRPEEDLDLGELNAPVLPSMEALFNSGIELDVVNICTANGLHSSQALEALSNDMFEDLETYRFASNPTRSTL